MGFLEKLLIAFCVFNLLFGVCLTSVGIWVIADSGYVSHILGTQLYTAASAFLLIGGIFFVITGILGLVAVSNHHSRLMKIFISCPIILFLLFIICAILAVVFTGEIEEQIQQAMRASLIHHYGATGTQGTDTTAAWDKLQNDFRCCAVVDEDWKIYRNTSFFKSQKDPIGGNREIKKYVPASCCVYNEVTREYTNVQRCQTFQLGPPGNPSTNFRNNYLFYEGCYQAAKAFLLDHSWVLVGLGFVTSIVMIAGFILGVIYYRRLSLHEKKQRQASEIEKTNEDL